MEHVQNPDPETRSELKLSLAREWGISRVRAALQHFGDAPSVVTATVSELARISGLSLHHARKMKQSLDGSEWEEEWSLCGRAAVRIIGLHASEYPLMLREIYDPPVVIYARGEFLPQDDRAIAIVGSRRCTLYGQRHTERLTTELVKRGFTIVSGLARGIDAIAHRAALKAGGRTLAVMAGGLGKIYPPEHTELSSEIAESGVVLSEMPMAQPPLGPLFPRRNRLISGLALGVVVMEAGQRSGTLITTRHAIEQGREVFAVPGPIDSLASRGCHRLIQDGAKLVQGPEDVVEELGSLLEIASSRVADEAIEATADRDSNFSELQKRILAELSDHPITPESIIASLELSASQVLSTLSVLEVRQRVRRLAGNRYCLFK